MRYKRVSLRSCANIRAGKSRSHFRDKRDQSLIIRLEFPSAFTAGLRSLLERKREREGESSVFESGEKKTDLSLRPAGLRTGPGRAGPIVGAFPFARSLVSVTNDAACSPLDVTRYQLGRSSSTRGASTLARRDSAECSR